MFVSFSSQLNNCEREAVPLAIEFTDVNPKSTRRCRLTEADAYGVPSHPDRLENIGSDHLWRRPVRSTDSNSVCKRICTRRRPCRRGWALRVSVRRRLGARCFGLSNHRDHSCLLQLHHRPKLLQRDLDGMCWMGGKAGLSLG